MNYQSTDGVEGVNFADGAKVYRYMNFDQIEAYADTAKEVTVA